MCAPFWCMAAAVRFRAVPTSPSSASRYPVGMATLPALASYMDTVTKPIVAAIHGFALGGGLELALACHFRCAVAGTQLGLPEVKLGILPGAHGTQRLPRVVGAERALEMIASGDPIGAEKALELGLIDEIVKGEIAAAGASFANRVVREGREPRKTSMLTAKLDQPAAEFFAAARARIAKEYRGYPAPLVIVDCVEAAVTLPFAKGVQKERELFEKLRATHRVEGAAPSVLRRAPGDQDPGRSGGNTDARNQIGRADRCRHHGRRHRHELRQRRHPGKGARIEPGGLGQGPGRGAQELRGHRVEGAAVPGGDGQAHGAVQGRDQLRRVEGRRHRDRGGVRGHGGQEAGVREAGQGLQAGRHPRHQYFDAGRQRDRRGDLAARERFGPALLQSRPT